MKMLYTALVCAMLMALPGCGENTANHLGATDDHDDVYGSNMYWDGYGINNGYDMGYSSYGTPKDQRNTDGHGIGQDLKDLGEDVKDAVTDQPWERNMQHTPDGNSAQMVN